MPVWVPPLPPPAVGYVGHARIFENSFAHGARFIRGVTLRSPDRVISDKGNGALHPSAHRTPVAAGGVRVQVRRSGLGRGLRGRHVRHPVIPSEWLARPRRLRSFTRHVGGDGRRVRVVATWLGSAAGQFAPLYSVRRDSAESHTMVRQGRSTSQRCCLTSG